MSLGIQATGDSLLFTIPEELDQKVPCQQNPELYDDPALDIDLDEAEWVALSGENQRIRLRAKANAEQRAIAACNTCPLLEQCRNWALNSGVEVYGVVGGTTPEERKRTSSRRVIDDPGSARRSKSERDEIIAELMDAAVPNKTIAERLGCSVRTIERRKAAIRSMRANRPVASAQEENTSVAVMISASTDVEVVDRDSGDGAVNDLIPSRVTPETAALFDALADGSVRDRSSLVESLLGVVSQEQALNTVPKDREYDTHEAKIAAGARKFLMNRLDISMRRGRVRFMRTSSGDILVGLDEQTAQIWNAFRQEAASSAA